jgi:predicted RND superfamily exporter protein
MTRMERVGERLADLQAKYPWRFVGTGLVLALLALPFVARLALNPDFQAMLPESAQSVRDLDEIRERFGATGHLMLGIQADDEEQLHSFVAALAPRISDMREQQVGSVEWSVTPLEDFVTAHRHLYARVEDLREIRDALDARVEYERARANPFYIDLGDEVPPDPEEVLDRVRADADRARGEMDRFPGGFFQHPDRRFVLVFVHTAIRAGDGDATMALVRAIESAGADILGQAPSSTVAGGGASFVDAGVTMDFGGDLMDVREETQALQDAVTFSTIITVVLLAVAIFAFFGRKRAIALLVIVLTPPTLVTFGIASCFIEYLNASSAFLGSIVVGNGVNSAVMWLGRYFEERREGKDLRAAIVATHHGTVEGTVAAAFAAAVAYGSLMTTTFRGFRDFGLIGSMGMILCWISAYTFLPALTVLSERWRALAFTDRERKSKGWFGPASARVALGSPRAVVGVCALLTIGSLIAIFGLRSGDWLEYDFRNLQSERPASSRVRFVNETAREYVEETQAGGSLVILAPDVDAVRGIVDQVHAYGEAHPATVGTVRSIFDLLPADQDEKVLLLRDIRRLLLEVRPHLSAERQQQVDENIPPEEIDRVEIADLPADVARAFTEVDGTRGRLVFVEHFQDANTSDGRYQIAWSAAARAARGPAGQALPVAGIAPVFADLLSSLYGEGPKTIGIAFLLTVLLVVLAFRRMADRVLTITSLMLGVLWMIGIGAAIGTKLNFLNMVAFPITFGIGVEYAVNFVKRVREEEARGLARREAIRTSLEGAGGAVVLCSITTIIGYVSLFASTNLALNSFGTLMTISEITCLGTAVVALPAAMYLFAPQKPQQ